MGGLLLKAKSLIKKSVKNTKCERAIQGRKRLTPRYIDISNKSRERMGAV
jgi:hypothetical protein